MFALNETSVPAPLPRHPLHRCMACGEELMPLLASLKRSLLCLFRNVHDFPSRKTLATRRARAQLPYFLCLGPDPAPVPSVAARKKHVCHILGPASARAPALLPPPATSFSPSFNTQSKFSSNLLELGNLFSGRCCCCSCSFFFCFMMLRCCCCCAAALCGHGIISFCGVSFWPGAHIRNKLFLMPSACRRLLLLQPVPSAHSLRVTGVLGP